MISVIIFYQFRMVIQANGKEYHSVEIQLGSVLIPKDKLESKFFSFSF